MWSARERGHGCVTSYLRQVGVARSTAYRWDKELHWLVESGAEELRRLRRECERLRAEAARRGEERKVKAQARRARLRALVLEAATLGTSDEEIVRLVWRVLGLSVSHATVNAVIAEASRLARRVFFRYFAGVGRVGAADEIFLGRAPLLLMVEPLSHLIAGLRLAEGCTAADWEPVFVAMKDLKRCVCDGGSGVNGGAKEAGLDPGGDLFHGLRDGEEWLGRFAGRCEKRLAAEAEARAALAAAAGLPEGPEADALRRRAARAVAEADRVVAEWCRLSDLVDQARRAFDLVTPEGRPNTPGAAQAAFRAALAAMERTPEGMALATELKSLKAPRFYAHLGALTEALGALRLEQVGPDREGRLGRLVAATVAWRRRDKDPVSLLRAAATGSLDDKVELAVIEAVDLAVRSSSAVECVNSRIRLVQVARKRLGEDFLYLLAVCHNLHTFGRGSVRKGKTPAELAGIELPTSDWIELLGLPADEVPAAKDSEAAPPAPSTAAADAEKAA